MAAARAGLLAALCLACALTGSLATRMPEDQAFVTVTLQHTPRRYILALGSDLPSAEAPVSDGTVGSLLGGPRAAPLAPASSLPAAPTSNSSADNSSSPLGNTGPAKTTRSPPPATTPPSTPRSSSSPANTGGSSTTSSSRTINENKVFADGYTCNIYSRSTSLQCTSAAPVPACCDSASNSATCLTYDSGANLQCITSVPYPACCEARDQPIEVCDRPTAGQCPSALPVPACCDSDTDYCFVYADASDVRCSSSSTAACCPA